MHIMQDNLNQKKEPLLSRAPFRFIKEMMYVE